MTVGAKAQKPGNLPVITQEELSLHDGRDESTWTCIDGVVYDVSQWVHNHPGGNNIIRLCAGREATCLFESYHPLKKMGKVRNVLASNKMIQPVATLQGAPEKSDDTFYVTLSNRVDDELKRLGMHRHSFATRNVIEAFATVAVWALCVYMAYFKASYVFAVFLGIIIARLGFLMHMGNHSASAHSPVINEFVGRLMDFAGSSSLLWSHEHQIAHHVAPNTYGHDNDCEIGNPLLRFHPDVEYRWWHRFQVPIMLLGMSTGTLKWFFSDFQLFFAKRVGSVTFQLTTRDIAFFLFFKSLWLCCHVLPAVYFNGWRTGLSLIVTCQVIGAYYMSNTFVVNHIQDALLPKAGQHWSEQQLYATANWQSGSHFWNFVSGGLNHQVEHHMFPSMPIYLLPYISDVCKKTCNEFNVPYNNFPTYWDAWSNMVKYLHALGDPNYKPQKAAILKSHEE
jgi:fatty acid desaturase/predicted heme/steroid binding protein